MCGTPCFWVVSLQLGVDLRRKSLFQGGGRLIVLLCLSLPPSPPTVGTARAMAGGVRELSVRISRRLPSPKHRVSSSLYRVCCRLFCLQETQLSYTRLRLRPGRSRNLHAAAAR